MRRSALIEQHMNLEQLYSVKKKMDMAEARKLQPHYVKSFFEKAFANLGGSLVAKEKERWEIRHVPQALRERDRVISKTRIPVARKYERVCFEKNYVSHSSKASADLLHPAHPLMASITDIILEKYRPAMDQGAILFAETDDDTSTSIVFTLEHEIKESSGDHLTVSKQLHFVKIDAKGQPKISGYAPHLDLRPLKQDEFEKVKHVLAEKWLDKDLAKQITVFASEKIVPEHLQEIKQRRTEHVNKIEQEVHKRWTKEISFWTDRYHKLKEDEEAGKQPRMQPENARRRVEDLSARLDKRKREVEAMRNVFATAPRITSAMFVIPAGLLAKVSGDHRFTADAETRQRVEEIGIQAVIAREKAAGNEVVDVSKENCGWDITSRPPTRNGKVSEDRHIEVKARAKGQDTITVTKNEVLTALNQKGKFILALVIVNGDAYEGPYYIKEPFKRELSDIEASTNLKLRELLKYAE